MGYEMVEIRITGQRDCHNDARTDFDLAALELFRQELRSLIARPQFKTLNLDF